MARRFLEAAALGVALVTFASVAQAQSPAAREGFHIGFGFGSGSAGATCDGCDDSREGGLSGYFRIGGALRPQLLLSGETNGWTTSDEGVDETVGFLSANAYYYPSLTNGFFLKGGLGISSYSAENDVVEMSGTGLALGLGLGYDFRFGQKFALTPYLNYLHGLTGEVEDVDFKPNLLQIGLGFNWY